MKQLLIVAAIIFLCLLIPKKENDEIRIRIISNSDSAEDINEKIMVKEAIVKILKKYQFEDVNSFLTSELDKVKKDLKDILPFELYQKLNITYELTKFPSKAENKQFLPSGKYKTLLIKIDEAKGSNWWSVLYPEFFLNESKENEVIFKWYIIDKLK